MSGPETSPETHTKPKRALTMRTRLWSRRVGLSRKIALILGVALAVSGLATIAALTETSLFESDLSTIIILLNLDLILALALGAVMARRIVRLWTARRRGSAGSRLHIRLVVLFSLVAVLPAILVAVFAGLFLNFGIESWFNERVRTAVNESQAVAQAYLSEHRKNIRADALAMANDLNRAASRIRRSPRFLVKMMTGQAALRSLTEAALVDGGGRIRARTSLSHSLQFGFGSREVMQNVLKQAKAGQMPIFTDESGDRVRAMVKLEAFVDSFLLVGRFIDPQVLDHVSKTRGATAQYQRLEKNRESLQIKFLLVFALMAVLLLFAAVWAGWSVASQLASPISDLIGAAQRVSRGDLAARIDVIDSMDEIAMLGRAFNRMTSQLNLQQQGLIEANRQLDERRRFTETVLSGVSAGVIGLDKVGLIQLPNRSASELLVTDLDQNVHNALPEIVPEMKPLLDEAMARPTRFSQGEISLLREGQKRTLFVTVAAEWIQSEIIGFVVTFDDITELLSAQRKAAWADVARRIAHEIKNPLTPIQLSAERLTRKYLSEITSDPETFAQCTETIVRQVEEMRRMVDEFSSFARMPQPQFKRVNLSELCRQTVQLESNRYPAIDYQVDLTGHPVFFECDRQQISRALTNILKNSAEAIVDEPAGTDGEGGSVPLRRICITLHEDAVGISLSVVDNGPGLPEAMIDRLTEPYVTTRAKGTGLGLAIAKKIMEDHNGTLLLSNAEPAGAKISLLFKLEVSEIESGEDPAPEAQRAEEELNESLPHGA